MSKDAAPTEALFTNTRRLIIEWGHCDPAGIVFNPRFFEFFDWSTALLFHAALGMTKPEMMAAYGCAGIPLVETRAQFLAPARFGDEVEIVSAATSFGRSSFEVRHRLLKAGSLSVEGFEKRVWVARDPDDPSRLRSAPIPAEVIARFQARAPGAGGC